MKSFPSKYKGKCNTCNGPIPAGTMINWSRELGAFHVNCEVIIDGKSQQTLADEWDREHANEPTCLDRFEAMRVDPVYKDVPEDAIYTYASQDTRRNPYR